MALWVIFSKSDLKRGIFATYRLVFIGLEKGPRWEIRDKKKTDRQIFNLIKKAFLLLTCHWKVEIVSELDPHDVNDGMFMFCFM